MKKFIVLTFLFFPLTIFCQTFHLDKGYWHDFEGNLGKLDIQLSIYFLDNGQLKGNYCYKKDETKIQLVGQITGNKIELTELLNGRPSGYFNGKIFADNSDWFEGIWTDSSKQKTLNFKLSLNSVCGGLPDNRYSDLDGTDEDVCKFLKHVKISLLNGDKEWIANHITYPIKTNISQGKQITVKNKKQLIDNFENIFRQKFKDKIKSICICNMFNNYQGVMLGNGEIWIGNKPHSTSSQFDYNIIAINN